jgi:hypothetical protein
VSYQSQKTPVYCRVKQAYCSQKQHGLQAFSTLFTKNPQFSPVFAEIVQLRIHTASEISYTIEQKHVVFAGKKEILK